MYDGDPKTTLSSGYYYPHFTDVELQHQEVSSPQITESGEKEQYGIGSALWADGGSLLPPWLPSFLHSLPQSGQSF